MTLIDRVDRPVPSSRHRSIRLLVYTSLFPNACQPNHGVFVENRLRHLIKLEDVAARVVAPVPWFPCGGRVFGRYGLYARVPKREVRYGIRIEHPRFPLIPRIGMGIAPHLMSRGTRRPLGRQRGTDDDFDLIDAHYFYPDGVAAAMLGTALDCPVVITARGSDINLIANYPGPRRLILWAAEKAAAVVAVSTALAQRMAEIGIDPAKIVVLRNGVDLETFPLLSREEARRALGITRPTMIAAGNLLFSKGQDVAIRALEHLPECELLLVGDGKDEAAFRRLVSGLGVDDRVRFVGRLPHTELARYYNAADVSVLASVREGWPNVLLESMACGTPVVASDVGGVGEIITAPEAGRLMAARTPAALAQAVRALLDSPPSRAATRAYAERFSWDETTRGQQRLFRRILADRGVSRNG